MGLENPGLGVNPKEVVIPDCVIDRNIESASDFSIHPVKLICSFKSGFKDVKYEVSSRNRQVGLGLELIHGAHRHAISFRSPQFGLNVHVGEVNETPTLFGRRRESVGSCRKYPAPEQSR